MSKIVVLNSGGFDSIVLSHYVKEYYEGCETHNLFFNYGQLNLESERGCSFNCAKKLEYIFKEITLPPFDWSDSVLSGGEDKSQYIPLRNLVFISYALSYAKGIGADKIFCAFIGNFNGEYYEDTSPEFLEKINELSKIFGIEILAPFIDQYKEFLLKSLARKYGIYENDFHSCNFGNTPCGKCGDCLILKEMYEDINDKITEDILIDNWFEITDDFINSIKQEKITSAKLYINNKCQFTCKHCFIGKQELVAEELTIEEWKKVLKDLAEIGVTYVDFFGKEPLYDDKIFILIEECNKLGLRYGLITNGVNIRKNIDLLEKYKPTISLSVEELGDTTQFRNTGSFIEDNIKLLVKRKIPVSVSIDLGIFNHFILLDILDTLYKWGVKDFYIKPLRPLGSSEEYLKNKTISESDLLDVIEKLVKYTGGNMDIDITLSLANMDLERLSELGDKRFDKYVMSLIVNRINYYNNLKMDFELFMENFYKTISITPDGFVLGNATEYCRDYSKENNLREKSLLQCINEGKEKISKKDFEYIGYRHNNFYRKKAKLFENILKINF